VSPSTPRTGRGSTRRSRRRSATAAAALLEARLRGGRRRRVRATGDTRRIRKKLERGQQYVHRGHGDVRTSCTRSSTSDVPAVLRGLRLHDLRHALGQWAHDAGVPLSRIKEMLRHTTLAMTERYARTSATRQVSSAVGKLLRTRRHDVADLTVSQPSPRARRRAPRAAQPVHEPSEPCAVNVLASAVGRETIISRASAFVPGVSTLRTVALSLL
jgi:hypothetical protein